MLFLYVSRLSAILSGTRTLVCGAEIYPQILWITLWILATAKFPCFGKTQEYRRRS